MAKDNFMISVAQVRKYFVRHREAPSICELCVGGDNDDGDKEFCFTLRYRAEVVSASDHVKRFETKISIWDGQTFERMRLHVERGKNFFPSTSMTNCDREFGLP